MKSFSEVILSRILLGSIDPEQKEYWIKSINRTSPNEIDGMSVEIVSLEDNTSSNVHFGKYSLEIVGTLEKYKEEIVQNFYTELAQQDPNFKKNFQAAERILQSKTKAIKEYLMAQMLDCLEKGRILQEDQVYVGPAQMNSSDWTVQTEKIGHEKIIQAPKNTFNTPDRIVQRGEVYYADLDPVFPQEIGGTRPVLVLNVQKDLVTIVPLSTKTIYTNKYSNMFTLQTEKYPDLEKKDQKEILVCTQAVRTINLERIFHRITKLKKEDFQKVLEAVKENLQLEVPIEEEVVSEIEKSSAQKGFYLTDEEACELIKRKNIYTKSIHDKSKITFDLPNETEGFYEKTLRGKCLVSNNPQYDYEMTISEFRVLLKKGERSFDDDDDLRHVLAQIMVEKFGEDYKRAYAENWLKVYASRYFRNPSEDNILKFQKHLNDIGKFCENPASTLNAGPKRFNYNDLKDVQENEN